MNRTTRQTLDTLACAATLLALHGSLNAPADAQSIEQAGEAVTTRYVEIAGQQIPELQAMSPATFEGVIAFRPNCTQLLPGASDQPGMTAWYWQMSDNQPMVLGNMPSQWSEAQAYKELNAYGLCKLGGEDVPNIYAWNLPKPQEAQVATLPEGAVSTVGSADEGGPNLLPYLAGGVAIAVVGCGIVGYRLQSRSVPQSESNGFVPHPAAAQPKPDARLTNLFED